MSKHKGNEGWYYQMLIESFWDVGSLNSNIFAFRSEQQGLEIQGMGVERKGLVSWLFSQSLLEILLLVHDTA